MEDITLQEVLREAMDSRVSLIHTVLPGKVVSVDSSKQTVTVKPMIKTRVETRDDELEYEELPLIYNVPLCFPQGGNTFIRWTVSEGDQVELRFSEVDLGNYKRTGGISEPGDDTKHGLNSCFATPCFTGYSPGEVPSGDSVVIEGGGIYLGQDATEFIARADRTDADIEKILTLLQTWTTAAGDGGAALKTAALTVDLSGSACDKVYGK